MTIYFVAAHSKEHAAIARTLSPKVRLNYANDNATGLSGNPVMRAALELFAGHGLGAASRACEKARAAASEGNSCDCRHWLAVCRIFDRRLANDWASRLGVALIA